MKCESPKIWGNCYSGSFDLIAPESFAHPAKMSPALCYRILEHLEELGLLKAGATILDPMGGTGMTAICANAKGYRAITCELEERFIGFQKENKDYASRKLHRPLDWTILQGDSRQLSKILGEHGLVTPGQIGNLKDKPIVITSPPYEGNDTTRVRGRGRDIERMKTKGIRVNPNSHSSTVMELEYGQSEGQVGNDAGPSYLSAMRQVYAEIAKVSDVLVVVTKNPTRNKQLRRLDLDTISLLEQTGWRILCVHEAQLFTEHEQAGLFGDTTKKVKGRMSFFKRLSWEKGSLVADHEDIIVAIKDGCSNVVTISSPPYADQKLKVAEDFHIPITGSAKSKGTGAIVANMGYETPGQIGNLK